MTNHSVSNFDRQPPEDVVIVKINNIGSIDFAVSRRNKIRVILIEKDMIGNPSCIIDGDSCTHTEKISMVCPLAVEEALMHIDN